jgi:hypothetical protein
MGTRGAARQDREVPNTHVRIDEKDPTTVAAEGRGQARGELALADPALAGANSNG